MAENNNSILADAPEAVVSAADEHAHPVMSKRQQKKQAKKQERKLMLDAAKSQKKQAKEANAVETKARKQADFDSLPEKDQQRILQIRADRNKKKVQDKAELQDRMAKARQEGPRVLIDLDFDEHMTENEIVSLTQQLSMLQGLNSKAKKPFALELSNVCGRTEASLQKRMSHYTQWPAAEVNRQPYIEAHAGRQADLVYLTADAAESLEDIDGQKIYIIGGIIDRNRHKNMCSKKAETQGIKTARLPLQEHYKLNGSSVLTINQVYEILLHYNVCKDWKEAIEKAIPARKLACNKEGVCQGVKNGLEHCSFINSQTRIDPDEADGGTVLVDEPIVKRAKLEN